jgi:hypothetical protein
MGFDGDFDPTPIEFPGITYTPGFETGTTWATQYTSELGGALALGQGQYYLSNFITRDLAGRTEGICVNPWDFNFVKARGNNGEILERPSGYTRTQFQKCDCSYHKCDKQFEGMGYTLDFGKLINGDAGLTGINDIFASLGSFNNIYDSMDSIGFPREILDPNNNNGYENKLISRQISQENFNSYKQQLSLLDSLPQGTKETNLLTYALIDLCQSVTGGLNFKNNIVALFAFTQGVLEINIDQQINDGGSDFSSGGGDWSDLASNIIRNYERNADIPGFTAELIYSNATNVQGLQEKCMCLDGGLHSYDALPFADNLLVNDQLTVEQGIGGMGAFESLGFTGDKRDLAKFLAIDGRSLQTLGITNAKNYKYGPNWAYGYGFSDLNVISVSTPEYKNWEVRNSAKIRVSGYPNGEPYSFGNQWLEWGRRIGVPPIEFVPINTITLGGGDWVDANFGYKGNIEGSLIYKGRLKSDVLAYETQDYEFAFLGATYGPEIGQNISPFLGLTTIRHIDAVTNEEAYGLSGSIEEIVFSEGFSESPQDKTIYRL